MHVSIKQVRRDLQELLDGNGQQAFPRLKALYLKDVDIIDEEGNPVSPEDVDVTIQMPADAELVQEAVEDEEEEKAAEKQEEEDDEEGEAKSFAKEVAAIVRKELKMNQKNNHVPQVRIGGTAGFTKVGSIKHFDNDESAYRFGRWVAACNGHTKSLLWCKDYGVRIKTHQETVNSAGGYLVPDEFSDQLISLREEYGVVRNNASIIPMASDVKRIPRRTDTMTAYWVGESASITASDQTFDQVNLVAKKLAARTKISNELNEDAMINLGDTLAGEIAYAFAKSEDEAAFNGDGTSTYGSETGLVSAATQTSAVTGGWSAIAMGDLTAMMGKIGAKYWGSGASWIASAAFYHSVMLDLLADAGGNTVATLAAGAGQPSFLGYPVHLTDQLPTATAADTHCLFGAFDKAVIIGDRAGVRIQTSSERYFDEDNLAIRASCRYDLAVHDTSAYAELTTTA